MSTRAHPSWRVVLFTDLPGDTVYRLVGETIRPLGHRIVGVVTSPGPRNRRTTDYLDTVASVPRGIDTIVCSHPARFAGMVAPLRPDLIVSAGFRWMLPPDLLALPSVGAINMHPSLLPRHRGPHPLEWTFREGDTEAGFTVHRLAAGFDTGPILSQQSVPVEDDDDVESLITRMFPIVPGLIVEALERLAHGEAGEPQDESLATHAGPFEDAWRRIDWTRPARDIHNQVRSWSGNRGIDEGAFGEVNGIRHTILRTRLVENLVDSGVPAGSLLDLGMPGVFIQAGDGPLEIVTSDPAIASPRRFASDSLVLAALRR